MSGIRAVISDFGGVLTTPLWAAFAGWNENVGADPADLGMALHKASEQRGSHPLYELEKGEITEDEFTAIVQAQLPPEIELAGFRDVWFSHLHPNEPMIDLMRQLRADGYRMALLTNNVREWEPLWRAKLPVDEIFELVVDSAFVGMRKPEPGIYELTLERLGDGIRAEECVFVDDVDVNCAAAEELGMRAVHYESAGQAIPLIRAAVGS
ncbi:MAG: putative hydrolase of the superfamily [Thermoleophilaceae bacterium]|jgi:epoxide hydrolase-like predicted phosphatase|nr:putative hydrolase of the superfamily [Thermoleophilaceae bacterium]